MKLTEWQRDDAGVLSRTLSTEVDGEASEVGGVGAETQKRES
jgi:hypothetical protein